MAKTKKGGKGGSAARVRERRERRFEPRPTANPRVVYAVGAVGALALGAGGWEEVAPMLREDGPEPLRVAHYVLAAGAFLAGVAVWLGTSGEPVTRVGDGGLAVEKGGLRRMPWYAIERVELRGDVVRVSGQDDAGSAMTVSLSLASHPQAAAWLVREARDPIHAALPVSDDAALDDPMASAGETIPLDPPQVVGKHCAATGKVIAYEPDARVCERCGRVYHKAGVPESCECGASLAGLRAEAAPS
jgi:hypothetical protein